MSKAGLRVKVPMFTLSLILSLVLWFAVQSTQPRGAQPLSARLEFQNLKEGYVVTSIPEDVQVMVEGTAEQLRQLDPERTFAVVDLADAQPGEGVYDVDLFEQRGVAAEFELIRRRVPVTIEKTVTKILPITVETTGQIPSDVNLIYQSADIEPDRVTISGPESEIERIDKVRALLDLSEIDSVNQEQLAPVEVLDERNRPLLSLKPSPLIAKVRPGLAAAPEMKGALVAPDFGGQPEFGFRVKEFNVSPNQVMIRGSSEALARVSAVATEQISLEGINETTTFDANVKLPRGVTSITPGRVRVQVVIERTENAQPTGPTTEP